MFFTIIEVINSIPKKVVVDVNVAEILVSMNENAKGLALRMDCIERRVSSRAAGQSSARIEIPCTKPYENQEEIDSAMDICKSNEAVKNAMVIQIHDYSIQYLYYGTLLTSAL